MMFEFEGVGMEVMGLGLEGFGVGGPVGSVGGIDDGLMEAPTPDEVGILGGDELRVRIVDERRAFNCIIWK
jgi:hypothetical protein